MYTKKIHRYGDDLLVRLYKDVSPSSSNTAVNDLSGSLLCILAYAYILIHTSTSAVGLLHGAYDGYGQLAQNQDAYAPYLHVGDCALLRQLFGLLHFVIFPLYFN